MPVQPAWLGVVTADALLSDLRPTKIHPVSLTHINLFLDEILISLLSSADSLNPRDLRTEGIPAVFTSERNESTGTRALGRSAVAEAEMELRTFYEGKSGRKSRGPVDGNGMRRGGPLAVEQAAKAITVRAMGFCTLCPDGAYSKEAEAAAVVAFREAGGEEDALDPAMFWLIAIQEQLAEHILGALSRVVARDSSQSIAGPDELYTTLCEDASIWGLFKKMQVKGSLEEAMRTTRSKRSVGPADRTITSNGSPHIGSSTPPRESTDTIPRGSAPPPSSFETRTSVEHRAASSLSVRKSPSITRRMLGRDKDASHERSGSVLSVNTKSMIGAYHDSVDRSLGVRSPQEEEEDWDALMRSGETMKVSLTPSRLKTFDTGRKSQPGSPNQSTHNRSQMPSMPTLPSDDSPLRRRGLNGTDSPTRGLGRSGGGSRSSSTAKLTARGATTIEENDEEDDLPGARRGKKESLADVLGGGSVSSASGPRTAPAVVVGSPPPPADHSNEALAPPTRTAERRPSVPSLNRPQGRMVSSGSIDEEFGGRAIPRRRTEAQELADFLSSTAPPPSSGPLSPMGTDTAKTKGLKGFMSKLAGGRQPSGSKLPKVEDIPTIDPALVAAKRKQTAAAHVPFATSSISSPASATSRLPSSVSAPSVEAGKPAQLRKRSDGKDNLPTARSVPRKLSEAGQGGFTNREMPREEVNAEEVVAGAAVGLGLAGAAAAATLAAPADNSLPPLIQRASSKRKAVPRVSADGADGETGAAATDAETAAPSASTKQPEDDSVPETAPIREAQIASVPVATSNSRTALGSSTSEVNSFMTADEGNRETSTQAVPPQAPAAEPTALPSISLDELSSLRKLLDHATSARECHLLLNAVLSQWGVPLVPGQSEPAPEDRVAAWLLAGRDGPGFVASTTSNSLVSKDESEVLKTPTHALSAVQSGGSSAADDGHGKQVMSSMENGVETSTAGMPGGFDQVSKSVVA